VKIVHDGNTLWIKRADQGFALSPGQKDVDHICITYVLPLPMHVEADEISV
jgi:hypothetical protein